MNLGNLARLTLWTLAATLAATAPASAGPNDCGQPVSQGGAPTASDALYTLRAAIGSAACETTVCDVDGSCSVTATDALSILRMSTGQSGSLDCGLGCFVSTTSTSMLASTTTTTTLAAATWGDVLDVFAFNNCTSTGCHGASFPTGNLGNLDDYNLGYDELLQEGVDCAQSGYGLRVLPGNPNGSFLVHKLLGTHDCGSSMPLGGGSIPQIDLDTIVSWIEAGAPKN